MQRLRIAMLERAWWLLDEGKSDEANAILEFLPVGDVNRLREEFFKTRNEFDAQLYKGAVTVPVPLQA
jgi:hypothetical protein